MRMKRLAVCIQTDRQTDIRTDLRGRLNHILYAAARPRGHFGVVAVQQLRKRMQLSDVGT